MNGELRETRLDVPLEDAQELAVSALDEDQISQGPVGSHDADPVDVLEQREEVPVDEEEV